MGGRRCLSFQVGGVGLAVEGWGGNILEEGKGSVCGWSGAPGGRGRVMFYGARPRRLSDDKILSRLKCHPRPFVDGIRAFDNG